MKPLRLLMVISLLFTILNCNSQTSKKDVSVTGSNSDKIEAYYFHFTARCVTCKTIEASAKQNLETLYPDLVKQGLITFQSVNLDEESSKPLAERLGISGQTLLLVKGDQKINLTNEGFMYAVVKPEKFKEIINERVESLIAR